MANTKQAKAEREEFAALDAAGLRARLDEEKKKLWQARFELGKRTLTNTAEIGKTRKRIARINTYLNQLEKSSAGGPVSAE
jgi:ribosomal protein L29